MKKEETRMHKAWFNKEVGKKRWKYFLRIIWIFCIWWTIYSGFFYLLSQNIRNDYLQSILMLRLWTAYNIENIIQERIFDLDELPIDEDIYITRSDDKIKWWNVNSFKYSGQSSSYPHYDLEITLVDTWLMSFWYRTYSNIKDPLDTIWSAWLISKNRTDKYDLAPCYLLRWWQRIANRMGDEFLPWENPNNCEVIYIHQEHDTVGVFEFGYDAAVSSWATIHVKQYPVDIWSDDNWSYKTKIIPLWELKDKDVYDKLWLSETPLKDLKRNREIYDDMDRFNYFNAELNDFPFTIFLSQIHFTNEEMDKKNTINDPEFVIKPFGRAPWWNIRYFDGEWCFSIKKPYGVISQATALPWRVEFGKLSLEWKTFSEKMEEIKECYNKAVDLKEELKTNNILYYDENGKIYTDNEYYKEVLENAGNDVQLLSKWKVENLERWYLGFWKNMQEAIKNGKAEVSYVWGFLRYAFVRLEEDPDNYYIISFHWDNPDAVNFIRVVDLK